ncbi:F-box protein SKIP17 [Citrus sinensis]|uniref:F-box protein SKIP17 n=1 Tax=Citrus sinensis TaxID=2711 RepID=A0ACB8MJQ6_CITSI|nr:F-box protein SKIP17 [Citrus sinensis]
MDDALSVLLGVSTSTSASASASSSSSTTSMAKRLCSSSTSQNPNITAKLNPSMDNLLETLLNLADSPPSLSIDVSFERLLDSAPGDEDQSHLIDRAIKVSSLLLESAKRSARKRASHHNFLAWPLPPDLTIKVFSMLDTQSLCHAAATCSMFNKFAMDPLCYANIDLRTVVPKLLCPLGEEGKQERNVHKDVNLLVSLYASVSFLIASLFRRRSMSLKLGIVPGPTASPWSCQSLVYTIRNSVDVSSFSWNDKKTRQGKESFILTRSCLNPLSGESGAAGSLLRRLHLYNIERMDNASLSMALSACPSLLDLEIVGLHVELRQTLMSVSMSCPLLERLFFESSKTGRDDSLKSPTCVDFVNNCPSLTSMALRGFKLPDYKIRILLKGFRKLKYVDFSTSYSITGAFLRNLGSGTGGNLLEVLILRDCMHLKEVEVARFLTAVLTGDFKFLRHLDISNREGLASEGDWYDRCFNSRIIPLKEVSEERPDICVLAEFPSEGSFIDIEQMVDSEFNSEISLPSQLSSRTSDDSLLMSCSESSYNSDHGSGNEEGQDSGYVIFEESSDEVDFLAI